MKTKALFILSLCVSLTLGSCINDLDTQPLDSQKETADKVYSVEGNYIKGLMKIYSILAMSGQDGAGSSDIEGVDAGNAQLYRSWWNLQEVPTDEAIVSWPNTWVSDMNEMKWTSTKNEAIEGVYQRCMYIVALANEYLVQTTDGNMDKRGMTEEFKVTVHQFRREARFVRAFAYYMLMDTFGRPPFITENNFSPAPGQISRADLFNWIESELIDIEPELQPKGEKYGRVGKGAVYALLSRMYLNAKVYTGVDRYTDCIKASQAVVNFGYTLAPNYANIFRADNDQTSQSEIIFPIVFDGTSTQSFGGIRFLISASRGVGEVSLENDGVVDGWSGNRSRSSLVKKFEFSNPNYSQDQDAGSILDKRGIFFAENRSLEIDDWSKTFESQGWAVYKYSNLKSDGTPGADRYSPDTDIPLFRLAEVYLNYAEAVKQGGQGGSEAVALGYINDLRKRGYGNDKGKVSSFGDVTLNFLLDERARELYWEAVRRTDLIRHNQFTTSTYLWPFKGGVKNGTAVDSYRNLYPIPVSDLTVNPSLTQNEGYK